MSQESQQDEFEKRTREVLEESATRLDGRTLSRLTQARHAALDQPQRPARGRWWVFVPAGAAAAVAVLAVSSWMGRSPVESTSPMEDLEFLTDAEASEFVTDGEELEFYEWAAGEMES